MGLKKKLALVRDGGRSEEGEQHALIEWSEYTRIPKGPLAGMKIREFLFAIPNGAFLNGTPGQRAAQMARLKRAGLLPGVHDLFLAVPASARHGLFIEMKRPGPGKVSDAQIDFATKVMRAGYCAALCRSYEKATEAIMGYLDGKNVPADLCFQIDWAKVAASVDRASGLE